jgi:hypothetical protein
MYMTLLLFLKHGYHQLSDAGYTINGYQPIMRKDRLHDAPGGGVTAWVSNNLVVNRRHDLELLDTESLWLEVRSHNNKFLLCSAYRPPNAGTNFWDSLQYMMDTINHIMIIGDLNADDGTRDGVILNMFMNANHLVSHINEPTRITPTSQTCLDRIISNMAHCVKDTQVVAPLLKNDHCTIGITLNFHITRQQCYTRLMWDYARGDFDGLRNHLLNVEWDDVCNNYTDVEIAAEQWNKTVLEALKAFIPNKLVTAQMTSHGIMGHLGV